MQDTRMQELAALADVCYEMALAQPTQMLGAHSSRELRKLADDVRDMEQHGCHVLVTWPDGTSQFAYGAPMYAMAREHLQPHVDAAKIAWANNRIYLNHDVDAVQVPEKFNATKIAWSDLLAKLAE